MAFKYSHGIILAVILVGVLALYTSRPKYSRADNLMPMVDVMEEVMPNSSVLGRCVASGPVKHFAMTKIEKTGSSTLFTILARFIWENKLSVVSMLDDWHIDWRKKRGEGWDIGPGNSDRADALINHARYNEPLFDQNLAKGYKLIVIIREPESWFKSAVRAFDYVNGNSSPQTVLMNDTLLYTRRQDPTGLETWFHLGQLQWLGFDYALRDNVTAMRQHVSWIAPKVDVIVLNEEYDASLVILRRRFCWEYSHMFYSKYVITNSRRDSLTEEARRKLFSPRVNLGDSLLYEELSRRWRAYPELKENDFREEVEHFSALNMKVSATLCPLVLSARKPYIVPASRWHGQINLTPTTCKYLKLTKLELVIRLARYSLGSRFHYT